MHIKTTAFCHLAQVEMTMLSKEIIPYINFIIDSLSGWFV